MKRKYDLAESRSESHLRSLDRLAQRFDQLEGQLTELESRIASELPQLGISVARTKSRQSTETDTASTRPPTSRRPKPR